MIRRAGNRGSFYPADCEDVKKMIDNFNRVLEKSDLIDELSKISPKALIVPHAGYIYSGFTANVAYRAIKRSKVDRVVVIGPSHHVYFKGISVATNDYYETPCGNLLIDKPYIKRLRDRFEFVSMPNLHYLEHSTETQMPFIRHYLPESHILEILYGDVDYKELSNLINFLIKDGGNLVVISSDLSHFLSVDEAKKLDNICLAGVGQKSIALLEKGCQACGLLGIKGVVEVAKARNLRVKLLDYRTSADISGDETRVVGYMSALFF